MMIFAAIFRGLYFIVDKFFELYYFLVFIRVILSWVNPNPFNPLIQLVRVLTDPIMEPLRRLFMPLTYKIRIDISPIFVFMIIGALHRAALLLLIILGSFIFGWG